MIISNLPLHQLTTYWQSVFRVAKSKISDQTDIIIIISVALTEVSFSNYKPTVNRDAEQRLPSTNTTHRTQEYPTWYAFLLASSRVSLLSTSRVCTFLPSLGWCRTVRILHMHFSFSLCCLVTSASFFIFWIKHFIWSGNWSVAMKSKKRKRKNKLLKDVLSLVATWYLFSCVHICNYFT